MKTLQFPHCITAAVLLAFTMGPAARGAGVIRHFGAEITAADADAGTVTLEHAPSGYTVKARITTQTDIRRVRYFDPVEIPDGQTVEVVGTIDAKNHTVTAGECSVQPIAERDLVVDAAQGRICGKFFHQPIGDSSAREAGAPMGDWIAKGAPGGAWTTADHRMTLGLETADGQRWRLLWLLVTPLAHQIEKGAAQDLRPGRSASVTLEDEGGQGELKSAVVDVWFKGAESRDAIGRCPRSSSSGITAPQMEAQLDAVRSKFQRIQEALARSMPVTMQVSPQLVMVGEPVELDFRILSRKQPNAKATLFPDYLHTNMGGREEIALPWKLSGSSAGLQVYTATVPLPSAKVGQYLVHWNCDIGGDIDQYSRTYAVCDNHSAVCLFLLCGGETLGPKAEFHKNYLPFDYWTGIPNLEALARDKGVWGAQSSREARQYGDDPDFVATPGPYNEPDDVQRVDVEAVHDVAPMLGYPDRPISIWSYALGNAGYREMQALGGMATTSLCTENHVDSGTEINCWGKPERPYFMSTDDFRKPGPGGPGALVAFSQMQRHTQLAQHYICDYCFEAACMGGSLLSTTGHAGIYDKLTYSRMFDGYNALFQMARCQKTPFFISQSVEMNGVRPGATEGNQMAIDYAVEHARRGDVVFADSCGVSQFYQRHYSATPESTCYFDDYWAGTHMEDKPDLFHDSMTMESGSLYALALADQILPESAYDYTVKWDYPDFGNETLPRRLHDPGCCLLPGKYDKYAATPRLMDTRSFQASRQDAESAGSLIVKVTVDARKDQRNLPLALWNLPREFERGADWFHSSGNCRFVPIEAPYTGNLNGFLIAQVTKGRNVFQLRISSPARTLQSMDVQIDASLRGKIFTRDGRAMAYIWPTGPWPATLHLHLPAGKSAKAYLAPQGMLRECAPGETTLEIPQEQWLRLVGLDREQIIKFASAEHQ
jgi:hypothetical protein